MSDGNVVKLVDVAPGFSMESTADIGDWMKQWGGHVEQGKLGSIATVAVVLETADGHLAVISQSTDKSIDRCRLVGLLTYAAHKRMDGGAHIEDLME